MLMLWMMLCLALSPVGRADAADAGKSAAQVMYVQTAKAVAFADGTLTLKGVSPIAIFFADRPERIVGHATVRNLVDGWGDGEDSFAADPPNAVLSVYGGDGVTDVVVVLSNPRLDGDDLLYDVRVLQGELPATAGASALFIDPVSTDFGPGSIQGFGYQPVKQHVMLRW